VLATFRLFPKVMYSLEVPADPNLDQAHRRRIRYAERKLRDAQQRLSRTERSITYWSRILADLRHQRTRAIQPPLWPEEDTKAPE
jgi:hypothetical protein